MVSWFQAIKEFRNHRIIQQFNEFLESIQNLHTMKGEDRRRFDAMTQQLWDRRYAKKGFAYGADPNEFLSSTASLLFRPPASPNSSPDTFSPAKPLALSLGEGEGRNVLLLSRLGFECTAIDISPVGLAKTRRRIESEGFKVKTIRGDVCGSGTDFGKDKWDLIVSIFCALDEEQSLNVYSRCIDALKPGGIFLLEGFAEEQLGGENNDGPKELARLLTPEKLRKYFSRLTILRCESLIRPLNEGTYHTGNSAVVQFVGIKAQPLKELNQRYVQQMKDILKDSLLTAETATSCPLTNDSLLSASSKLNQLTIDFSVLCHPLEFMRSTSSGKLVSTLLGGDFLLYSNTPAFQSKLRQVLSRQDTLILYPSADSIVVDEMDKPSFRRPQHVIALDGTWAQAKALLEACLVVNPKLRCVRLKPESASHFSKLVDAVHPGFGAKRMTTFEACWFYLQEILQQLGLSLDESIMHKVLEPIIHMIKTERNIKHLHDSSLSRRAPKRVDDTVLHSWGEAFHTLVASLPKASLAPPASTFCNVCGVTMSSPSRMQDHVLGKRHCLAVARRMLYAGEDRSPACKEDVLQVFELYSSGVIIASKVAVEPPDVAFVQVFP